MTAIPGFRLKAVIFLLIVQCLISLFFTVPRAMQSVRAFKANFGLNTEEIRERVYGPFYQSMTAYLQRIPLDENAVVIEPPGEFAHYFWILNYFFLPRRIYELPADPARLESFARSRHIHYAILTRPDGFYFDFYPPAKAP